MIVLRGDNLRIVNCLVVEVSGVRMLDTESRAGSGDVMMGYINYTPMLSTSDDQDKADNSSDNLHPQDKSPASSPGELSTLVCVYFPFY